MKKTLIIGLLALAGLNTHAQLGGYGVKTGIGLATISDDLAAKSPILAANIGGYLNYTFLESENIITEMLYLQTGLNLNRRGGNFEEIFERGTSLSIRQGYYHTWYLQLPILAGLHYELPIRTPGHIVGILLGPAVNFGLFGTYADRKITPGIASAESNYDVHFNGSDADRKLFNHINRLDISALVSFTYEHGPYSVSFTIDRGFLATSDGDDILRIIESQNNRNRDINVKIPNGHNIAYLLTLSYQLGNLSNR